MRTKPESSRKLKVRNNLYADKDKKNIDKRLVKYEVIEDIHGKPFTNIVYGDEQLKDVLRESYHKSLEEEYGNYDILVYRDEEDITESQFINEMIEDVMHEDLDTHPAELFPIDATPSADERSYIAERQAEKDEDDTLVITRVSYGREDTPIDKREYRIKGVSSVGFANDWKEFAKSRGYSKIRIIEKDKSVKEIKLDGGTKNEN